MSRRLLALTVLAVVTGTSLGGTLRARPAQAPVAAAPSAFDRHFTGRTMRVDYFHTGKADARVVTLDRVVDDGPWAGSRTRLQDDTNLGGFRVEVVDRATNLVIYSRGFGSIFGEWETTPAAKTEWRTFHDSLRIPWPKAPVQVRIARRAPDQSFRRKGSMLVPFLGVPAMTNTALSSLARISGAPVVPYFAARRADGAGYELRVEPPLADFPGTDPAADALRVNAIIERHIRLAPEQYFWVHRRFKGRPEPFADPYARPGGDPPPGSPATSA